MYADSRFYPINYLPSIDEQPTLVFKEPGRLFVGENRPPDGCNLHPPARCVILYRCIPVISLIKVAASFCCERGYHIGIEALGM